MIVHIRTWLVGVYYYVTTYNTSTGEIITEVSDGGTVQPVLSESDLGMTPNDLITSFCVGDDKHFLYAITSYPFAYATVDFLSSECVVTPPPPPPVPPVPPPVVTMNYIAYQVRFRNFEDQIVTANIFDQTTYEEGR